MRERIMRGCEGASVTSLKYAVLLRAIFVFTLREGIFSLKGITKYLDTLSRVTDVARTSHRRDTIVAQYVTQ